MSRKKPRRKGSGRVKAIAIFRVPTTDGQRRFKLRPIIIATSFDT
jgi:hypothetical protein